jgi:Domain of unknown function (DUF4404)
MADEHDELRTSLERLRSHLEEIRKVDPMLASDLDVTIGEAKAAIDRGQIEPAKKRSLIERLSDAVLKYEASHPTLAANLGGFVDALAAMGI